MGWGLGFGFGFGFEFRVRVRGDALVPLRAREVQRGALVVVGRLDVGRYREV